MSIEPDPHARQSPVRVAVVEPDPAHAELTVIALEREGHEVRRAIDGAGLGDLLAEFDADVIVSEWALGRSDGSVVLDRVAELERRRGRPLPVVFVTGEERARVSSPAGLRFHLVPKPVRLDQLREVVRRASTAEGAAPTTLAGLPLQGK